MKLILPAVSRIFTETAPEAESARPPYVLEPGFESHKAAPSGPMELFQYTDFIVYFIMEKFQKYIYHCSFEKTQNFQKFKNLIFERFGEIEFFFYDFFRISETKILRFQMD